MMQKTLIKTLLLFICSVGSTQAAIIEITSSIDNGGVCVSATSCTSLRSGIVQAADGDILTIQSGSITLTSTLVISKGLTLQGVGSNLMVLDGTNTHRIIDYSPINSGSVLRIINIQLQNGKSNDGLGGAGLLIRQGLVSVQSTTFYNNSSTVKGGAIMNNGDLNVLRSTFFQNNAPDGSAIYIASASDLKIHFSTLVNNSVGAAVSNNGALTSEATLFHNSLDCNGTGSKISQGYNVESAQSCVFSTGTLTPDFADVSTLPVASTLSNAGKTQVLLPLTSQVSIVDQGASTCTGVDQVGTTVPQNTRCDIGAVEVPSANAVTNPATNNNSNNDDDDDDDDEGEGVGGFGLDFMLLLFGLFLIVKNNRKEFI